MCRIIPIIIGGVSLTAEIGILNRHGVALAADSAVTIGGRKVFNSANKLFALSKFHPVGIMVYGNGSFMGVPWETIIKAFRKNMGNTKYDSLFEYADKFISYLFSNEKFATQESEKSYVMETFFDNLDRLLDDANNDLLSENILSPTESDLIKVLDNVVDKKIIETNKLNNLADFDDNFIKEFSDKYADLIIECIDVQIKVKVPDMTKNKLLNYSALCFSKDRFNNYAGVVISGFGEEDIFPRLYQYSVEGKLLNRNRYKLVKETKIAATTSEDETIVSINPFAQQEMVHLFVEGIDPYLNIQIFNLIQQFTSQLPNIIEDIFKQVTNNIQLKEEDKIGIQKLSQDILYTINEKFSEFKQEKYVDPLIDAVSNLPKDELAALAEALINITSIKRKMTINLDTVGGPIDVAVITKGDGFIWIKRKHYFQPELNHSFFKNYMWGDEGATCKLYDGE